MALLYSFVPTLVESLTIKQITVAGAWAQSTPAPDQESSAGEEEKITPTGEQEKAPAEKPDGVPEEDQGTAHPEEEADEKEEVKQEQKGEQDQEEEEEGYIDRVHRWLSGGVGESAQDVDEFFGDATYESEATNTRLRLRFDTFFEEHEDVDFKVRVHLRLVLPKTNKRLKLTFSGSPDDDEGAGDDLDTVTGSGDDNNAEASLAFTAVDTAKQNVSLRTGIKSGPAWWIGPRYRFYTKLGPIWGFRFTQLLRWLTDDGWEFRSTFDFERKIGEKFFFRTTARGIYNQEDWKDDGYKYRLQAKLFQFVTPNIGLRYEWINKFITKPNNHLDEIILKFGYRQRIWRKWLFFEIVPQASFPDDRDFEFVPGILFRVETNFGKKFIGKIK